MKPDLSALKIDPLIPEPADTLLDYTVVKQKKAKSAKEMIDLKRQLKLVESQFYEAISEENELKGLHPAIMTATDLTELLKQAITTEKPISKLFKAHEQSQQLPTKWADRTLKKKPVTEIVNFSMSSLKKQGFLKTIESYELLKIIKFNESNTYRKLCRTLRSAQILAEQFQDKDQKLKNQATTIKNQSQHISALQKALAQAPSKTIQEKAVEMRNTGKTIKEIANTLGKSPPTISKYIKSFSKATHQVSAKD